MTPWWIKKPGYPEPTVSALVADLDNMKTVKEQEKNPKQKELKNSCVDALGDLSQHGRSQRAYMEAAVFCRLPNTQQYFCFVVTQEYVYQS